MKLACSNRSRRRQGSVTFIVIALLSLICLFVFTNNTALSQLHRELRLVEKEQAKKMSTNNRANPVHGQSKSH